MSNSNIYAVRHSSGNFKTKREHAVLIHGADCFGTKNGSLTKCFGACSGWDFGLVQLNVLIKDMALFGYSEDHVTPPPIETLP